MSSKIHHNTAKKAKKYGIELVFVIDGFTASKGGVQLASNASAGVALEQAIAKLNKQEQLAAGVVGKPRAAKPKAKKARKPRDEDDESEDGEEGDEPEDEGHSIIKRKYKEKYRPFKMTCGDDLSVQVAEYLKVKDDGDGKMRIDEARLKRFAVANACWVASYKDLNIGLRRMNVVNRLRARVRRDKHKIVWAE